MRGCGGQTPTLLAPQVEGAPSRLVERRETCTCKRPTPTRLQGFNSLTKKLAAVTNPVAQGFVPDTMESFRDGPWPVLHQPNHACMHPAPLWDMLLGSTEKGHLVTNGLEDSVTELILNSRGVMRGHIDDPIEVNMVYLI